MKSYKILLLFVVLAFLSIPQYSQAQLWVGGRIGGTSASITGTGLANFQPDPKMYLNGGISSSFSLNRRFNLHAQLIYSGKGAALKYDGDFDQYKGATIEFEQKLHYLSVPLMLQFKMGDRDNHFHLDAGIVFNQTIGDKFSGKVTVTEPNNDQTVYDLDAIYSPSNSDLSYAIGVGLMASGVTFDFRYEVGINEIYKSAIGAPKIYNRAFIVTVGYMINLL